MRTVQIEDDTWALLWKLRGETKKSMGEIVTEAVPLWNNVRKKKVKK